MTCQTAQLQTLFAVYFKRDIGFRLFSIAIVDVPKESIAHLTGQESTMWPSAMCHPSFESLKALNIHLHSPIEHK